MIHIDSHHMSLIRHLLPRDQAGGDDEDEDEDEEDDDDDDDDDEYAEGLTASCVVERFARVVGCLEDERSLDAQQTQFLLSKFQAVADAIPSVEVPSRRPTAPFWGNIDAYDGDKVYEEELVDTLLVIDFPAIVRNELQTVSAWREAA